MNTINKNINKSFDFDKERAIRQEVSDNIIKALDPLRLKISEKFEVTQLISRDNTHTQTLSYNNEDINSAVSFLKGAKEAVSSINTLYDSDEDSSEYLGKASHLSAILMDSDLGSTVNMTYAGLDESLLQVDFSHPLIQKDPVIHQALLPLLFTKDAVSVVDALSFFTTHYQFNYVSSDVRLGKGSYWGGPDGGFAGADIYNTAFLRTNQLAISYALPSNVDKMYRENLQKPLFWMSKLDYYRDVVFNQYYAFGRPSEDNVYGIGNFPFSTLDLTPLAIKYFNTNAVPYLDGQRYIVPIKQLLTETLAPDFTTGRALRVSGIVMTQITRYILQQIKIAVTANGTLMNGVVSGGYTTLYDYLLDEVNSINNGSASATGIIESSAIQVKIVDNTTFANPSEILFQFSQPGYTFKEHYFLKSAPKTLLGTVSRTDYDATSMVDIYNLTGYITSSSNKGVRVNLGLPMVPEFTQHRNAYKSVSNVTEGENIVANKSFDLTAGDYPAENPAEIVTTTTEI